MTVLDTGRSTARRSPGSSCSTAPTCRSSTPSPTSVAYRPRSRRSRSIGLWSRLRAFDPTVLSTLLTQRHVVRTHLMRRTVHLLVADDVVAWRARHDAMLRQRVLGVYRGELDGVDLDDLAAAARAVMADGEPRSMPEIGRALSERWPTPGPRALGEIAVARCSR